MKTTRTFLVLFVFLTLLQPLAAAGQDEAAALDANEVLMRVDDVLNAPQDQTQDVELALIEQDGTTRSRTLRMWQKGDDTRTVKFLAPADVRNIAFLSLPDDVMYLYLPAFEKVRRIASHVKNQRFAGTDFTYDDMGTIKYAEDYDARFGEGTEDAFLLVLTPKEGTDKDYGRLEMSVLRETFYPTRVQYYDRGDNLWKVMERRELSQVEGYWTASEIEMNDLKAEHRTIMTLSNITFDEGLSDDLFTQRFLTRR